MLKLLPAIQQIIHAKIKENTKAVHYWPFVKGIQQWLVDSLQKKFLWCSHHPSELIKMSQIWVNSLWPSDAIWRHSIGSPLAQVMACCLIAPSHYVNQCWLIISKVKWHSYESIIIRRSEDTSHWNKIENCIFKITTRSPRDQWVNKLIK